MDSDADESEDRAGRDATVTWATAIGLDDATPERFDATAQVLLNALGCDAGRIAAAAAVCRAHHTVDDAMGWDQAADLLEQLLQRLRDAGADRDDQAAAQYAARLRDDMFPEPEPFTWPDRTAPGRRWQRRLWVHARLRWRHQPPRHPGAHQLLLPMLGRTTVGKLDYQVCDECRRGYLRKFHISDRYRGLGLGTRAIRVARRGREDYHWSTTTQYPTNGTFWNALGLTADPDGDCPHMQRP